MPSLYDTLGVSRTADAADIKKAHRKLVIEHHPDKGGDAEQFKQIQHAYEILSDDRKRAVYDQTGQDSNEATQDFSDGIPFGGGMPFHMGANPFGGRGVPFDIGNLFGMFGPRGPGAQRQGSQQQQGKAPPKVHEVAISLADFYHGKEFTIKFERQKFCETCKGSGAEKMETCGGCNGSGSKVHMVMMGPGMMAQMQHPCDDCGSTGKRVGTPCAPCGGKKFKAQEKSLTAKIVPGMRPGETLIFSKECSDQPEFSEPGDVHITLQEADEAIKFRRVRDTDDLQTVLHISLKAGLLGCTETIHTHPAHPDGLAIVVPPGTQNGEVLRIPGEGLRQKSGGRGALHVTVMITVTTAERATLKEKMAQLSGLFA